MFLHIHVPIMTLILINKIIQLY